MSDINRIKTYCLNFRQRVELSWSEETASPNMRPTAGKPESAGQCAPSSIILFSEFKKEFGNDLLLKIAVGKVVEGQSLNDAIELHVWLQLYEGIYKIPIIVDVTPDQAENIGEKVIFERNTELIETHKLIYLPFNLFNDPTELKPETQARAELLLEQMTSQK